MMNKLKNYHPLSISIYILLGLFFVISPFYTGVVNGHELHLEPNLYVTFMYSSILMFILAFFLYRHQAYITRQDWFHVLAWLLPLCAILALTSAAAYQDAIHSILIQVFHVALFLVGYYFSKAKGSLRPLLIIMLISAYVLTLFTLSEWFGTEFVTNSVVYSIGDYRLFSPLIYPNSYAALMIAFFFVSSYLTITTKYRRYMVLSCILTIPTLLSLLLTYSRGGYLIFVFLYLLILFLMPFFKQIVYLIFSLASFILTAAAYPFISKIGIKQQTDFTIGSYLLGWFILILACSLLVAFTLLVIPRLHAYLEDKLAGRSFHRYARFMIPVLSIVVAIAGFAALSNDAFLRILPEQLQNRLGDINFRQHSVLERITFYSDGAKIISDYPVFGAGGGAWNALYQEYQNNPYVTKSPHNYLLRHTIENGLLGLGVLLTFLAFVYVRFIRNRNMDTDHVFRFAFFVFATAILIHSLIDFNMDFLYISGLVYLSLGVMSSSTAEPVDVRKAKPTRTRNESKLRVPRWAYMGSVCIVALITIIGSSRSLYAHQLYEHTITELNKSVSADEAVQNLNTVLSISPHNPHYLLGMVALMQALYDYSKDPGYLDLAQLYIEELKASNGNFVALPEFELKNNIQRNDLKGAAATSIYWVDKFPWNVLLYENSIIFSHQLGAQQLAGGEHPSHWDDALHLYEKMKQQIRVIEALPKEQLPGKDFYIPNGVIHIIAQIYFDLGQYDKVLEVIESHFTPSTTDMPPELLQLYLSAQDKLSILDNQLYDQYIVRYPDHPLIN